MRVLGIETSCDETGVAIYDAASGLLSEALHSQIALHAPFGGVVPEVASRDHTRKIVPLIEKALSDAGMRGQELDGIAYTAGPGLMGALMVGAMVGRTLAYAWGLPAVGVHHLEGHLLAPCLEVNPPTFPFLALLVSGGHTELVEVRGIGDYHGIGDTLDDAAGEAFDKTAKLLGLGYPGGAALSKLAESGKPGRYHFPRPMLDRPGLDFSFSGLKTAALHVIKAAELTDEAKADIANAFQEAIVETLTVKCQRALKQTGFKRLVIAGGVGANRVLRASLQSMGARMNVEVYFPRPEFCTDNGAMIAYAGCMRLMRGERDELGITVRARWPLEEAQAYNQKT